MCFLFDVVLHIVCALTVLIILGCYKGKGPSLYRHDLLQLLGRITRQFSIPVSKLSERLIPRLVDNFPLNLSISHSYA